jgi:hypothetical protein
MRETRLSAAILSDQLVTDIATENELITKLDQAQVEVIAAVRDDRLAAYGRRALAADKPDPSAIHEKLDPKLFLGPRVIDLDGWVRPNTRLPFDAWKGYEGPYFDLVRFKSADLMSLWSPMVPEKPPLTVGAESRMQTWLAQAMRAQPSSPRSKSAMRTEAEGQGLTCGDRGYARAWTAAVNETGATAWSRPGRRKS